MIDPAKTAEEKRLFAPWSPLFHGSRRRQLVAGAALWALMSLALLAGQPAAAGPVGAHATESDTVVDALVVQGYRASLQSALAAKRLSDDIIEVISAEDVADFPDLNLAEALQRVPGVAIDRDAGEGRSITVRGLSSEFTRVRINGLEALATTGGKDTGGGSGGSNRGRGFDFQVFASELFNRVTVRKSLSAEIEEGSLGATVDLRPARPFDYKGFTAVGSLQQGYNDLSRSSDPRASFLISDTWRDNQFGALLSVAYSDRQVREEGSSSGRWENPSVAGNSGGCFETPGPCNAATKTYSTVNAAWHPRIPRYERLDYSAKRLGATGALQWKPKDGTLLSLNALYAYTDGERREDYLQSYLIRRGMDVTQARFDSKNQMIAATMDDIDVRAESRHDILTSEFTQVTFDFEHRVSSHLSLTGAIGASNSIQDNPVQTTLSLDRYDVDGYSYDFSGNERLPALRYNFDVTDPNQWTFTASNALGDPSYIRLRPNKTSNRLASARLDGAFEINEALRLKAGLLVKAYDFHSTEWRRNTINGLVDGAVALPTGVTTADLSRLVSGLGRNMDMPDGTPRAWLAPDIDKLVSMLGIECNCVSAYGDFRVSSDNQRSARRDISEDDASGYVQMDFDTAIQDMRLRGNAGVRYATTKTSAAGIVGVKLVERTHRYSDVLPSLNLALEPREDVIVRLGISKVMSRPQLSYLTPGGTLSNTARTLTVGNPDLAPIRATALDLNLEWYPDRDSILAVSLFRKDLKSYIQSSLQTMPFSQSGLPISLLANGNTADTVFTVSQLENTKGGELNGYEISLQRRFSFLPAPFDRFGGIANYTHVDSEVAYITNAANTPVTTVIMPLTGLSSQSYNVALYYEGKRLTGRVSAAYRDGYLGSVPGGNGNDARGKQSALTVDMSATLALSSRAVLTFEGLNLLDTFDDRWISRERNNSEEYSHTGRQYYVGIRYSF